MRIYTVHAPPDRDETDQFIFVRDGFRWLAFLFPAFWLLANRAWLALFGYLALMAGFGAAASRIDEGIASALWPLAFAINLMIGFDADSLRRQSLAMKGWRMLGVAAGRDQDEAEHSFFSRFIPGGTALRRGEALRPRDMVGLFPDSGR